jgi:hypothetical protein
MKTSGTKLREASGNIGSEKADEAVAAHLQQHAGKDHRARRSGAWTCASGSQVWTGPHRHLHREAGEEGQPQPVCTAAGSRGHQRGIDVVPGLLRHVEHGDQHQHRAEQV